MKGLLTRALALLLLPACAGPPSAQRCEPGGGTFAFPSPLDAFRGRDAADAPGDDHPHGDTHEGAWHPGDPAVGALTLGLDGVTTRVEDAWRPARTVALRAWQRSDAPPAAFADEDAARWLSALGDGAPPVGADGALLGEVEAPPEAVAERWAALEGRAPRRCVDGLCLLEGGAVVALGPAQGAGARRLVGLLAPWDGAPDALMAFADRLQRRRIAPYQEALGEVLSREEAGGLPESEPRLEALRARDPDNPFLTYFLARNLAGRRQYRRALELVDLLLARPDAASVAALSLSGAHEEWTALREHPRYGDTFTELLRRVPDDPGAFGDWLVRFRASVPHLRAAALPGGPDFLALRSLAQAIALAGAEADGKGLTVTTAAGTFRLELRRGDDGLLGVAGLEGPAAR